MEREISEIFCLNGKQLRVENGTCKECYLLHVMCFVEPILSVVGRCSCRKDKEEVCFKLIRKNGDKKKR